MSENRKPNEGKAWATKPEAKQREMERLMQYAWFQEKSDADKQMMIPVYSGVINGVNVPAGSDCYIDICKEMSQAGQPQLSIRINPKKAPAPEVQQAPPQTSSNPFGDDFGI